MIICHIGKMGSLKKEGIITKNIAKYCRGKHLYYSVYGKKPPIADLYILHCFRNDYEYFVNWKSPSVYAKIISLIHSYEPCMPNRNSNVVVTITNAWQKHLKEKHGIESVMIYPGIDFTPYDKAKPNLKGQVIGRISRAERGKFHPEWNYIILGLLKRFKKLKYRLVCKNYGNLPIIKNKCVKYIDNVKINQTKKKIKELCKMSIYIDAHDNFIETFSIGLLEAMACGLPVILYTKGQDAMSEVLGEAGIKCKTIEGFNKQINTLLKCPQTREIMSNMSKERAREFCLEKFVNEWNDLLIRQYAKVDRWHR